MVSLFELQEKQRRHDEEYHRDIYYMSHQERFRHVTLHFGKYSGRIAHIIKDMNAGKECDTRHLIKTLTDWFIVILNTAEIFQVDLEKEVRKYLNVPGKSDNLNQLISLVSAKVLPNYKLIASSKQVEQLTGLLLELDDTAGVLHKSCEELDHMYGIDREQIREALVKMLIILFLGTRVITVNYENSIPLRWNEIEGKSIL